MAKGPRYRVPFRRRREGKTNYHKRLKLIKSNKNRLVIRASVRHTVVQIFSVKIEGDKILAQAHTSQLKKEYKWNYSSGNLPSAYLTGFLCGQRAKKAGVDDIILDAGVIVHSNRVKAAFKGLLDAGIEVAHNEDWFPETLGERIDGSHIQSYAELLKKEDKSKYDTQFSKILKQKAVPEKITDVFGKVKASMEKL